MPKTKLDLILEALAIGLRVKIDACHYNRITQMLEIAVIKHKQYDDFDIEKMDKVIPARPKQLKLPFEQQRRRRKNDGKISFSLQGDDEA